MYAVASYALITFFLYFHMNEIYLLFLVNILLLNQESLGLNAIHHSLVCGDALILFKPKSQRKKIIDSNKNVILQTKIKK